MSTVRFVGRVIRAGWGESRLVAVVVEDAWLHAYLVLGET